ncbi:retrovirus-related pol polyprotein from transposon TNT 1-94 [Tanacetum coccineum]
MAEKRLTRKSFPKKQRMHKESVSKQGRKFAKGKSSVQRDPLFDELPKDTVDHMETENAQGEGRTRNIVDEDKEIEENVLSTEDVLSTNKDKVSTEKEKVSTDRLIVSTDGSKVSTDRQIEGTDEQNEGTEEHNEGTEEHIEGTEVQIESTDGQRKSTEDHTKEGSATQATQTPTSTIFRDDETIAKVLLNMSQAKVVSREKDKGVELKDIEEADKPRPTSTRSLLTLKPLPKIDPKDKGKKKIEEEDESESESDGIPEAEKKFKQLASDEEMARKIQEEWEGEEERNRLAEEKATNEALIRNYDDIKARIEADRLLAEKLQEEEREQFTIEERAKFLHDTIAAQRKFLAQQRSEAIRNRPPTKNQLRNQMMTYLKHVGNFKHSELKTKKFEEIQALYEKIKRSDEDFISIGSAEDERLIKKMNEKGIDSSKNEMVKEESKEEVKEESKEEESNKKRKLGTRKKMKLRKRRFIQNTSEDDSEKENDELRLHLTIAPDEEKEVDYVILDRKYPIKEWKTECLGTKPQVDRAEHLEEINQNVVIRSNGQKRYFSTLMRVLSIFDRDDLNAVYQLVMDRYQDEIPEGFDRDWNIVSWKLHGSSGVHTLVTEKGLVIHMLVEKKVFFEREELEPEEKVDGIEKADSLLKTIWFINAPCYGNEALASPKANELTIPEQTATGKGTSNPLMAGSLPKTTKPTTLIEAARTMLSGSVFSKQYCTKVVATACYTQNRSTIVKSHLKTYYEIFCRRLPNINFFHVFGCPVFFHNHKDHLGKFDEEADDGYFLGYSLVSKAFRVFNTRREQTEETYHITFDKSTEATKFSKPVVDDINIAKSKRYPTDEYLHPFEPSQRSLNLYPLQLRILLALNAVSSIETEFTSSISSIASLAPQDRWSRDKHIELVHIVYFLFEEEPKKVSEVLKHPGWVHVMQEELNQFTRNNVWTLVPPLTPLNWVAAEYGSGGGTS